MTSRRKHGTSERSERYTGRPHAGPSSHCNHVSSLAIQPAAVSCNCSSHEVWWGKGSAGRFCLRLFQLERFKGRRGGPSAVLRGRWQCSFLLVSAPTFAARHVSLSQKLDPNQRWWLMCFGKPTPLMLCKYYKSTLLSTVPRLCLACPGLVPASTLAIGILECKCRCTPDRLP